MSPLLKAAVRRALVSQPLASAYHGRANGFGALRLVFALAVVLSHTAALGFGRPLLHRVDLGALAVAGFSPDQLQVTVEDRQLVVAGKRDAAGSRSEDSYLHRGIAARGFLRTFVLADGMVVEGATLEHGLLHIDLARPEPENRVQNVPIRTAG